MEAASQPSTPTTPEPGIQISGADWMTLVRTLGELLPSLEVWAFGSRARRTAKPYSDIDLALITAQPLSLGELARINDAFDSSDLTVRVDVVDWASASEAFRNTIRQDKVVVQKPAC